MNEVTISTPYDIIVQQQIDIIASRQKDILEGKEGVSDSDLHNAIAELQSIKCCIPNQSPFGSNIFRQSTIGAYNSLKDQLKGLDQI